MENNRKHLKQLRDKWKAQPVSFVEQALGKQVWEKQADILHSVRDHKRTSVRSGNTCGKTVSAVFAALWFLSTTKDSIVIVTSPTLHQMRDVFFRTLGKIYTESAYPIGGKLGQTYLNFGEKHFMRGFCYREGSNAPPEGIQGHHSESGILFIIDECTAVPDSIFDAIEGSLNTDNAKLLMIGNPLRLTGEFYRSHTTSTQYNKIHISAYDVPNVKEKKLIIPGLVTHTGVADMRRKWGKNSHQFKVRVLGDFPDAQEDTIIGLDLVEAAMKRSGKPEGDIVLGCDVARYGDDKTAFVKRHGDHYEVLEVFEHKSTMYTAGRCTHWLDTFPEAHLNVDAIGLGAGVVDRLLEQEEYASRVTGVNVADKPDEVWESESTDETKTFANLRIQLWWRVREALKTAVLDESEHWQQLAVPIYFINSGGKLQAESKKDMKERVGISPDVGDATCLTHARPDVPHMSFIS